MFFNTSTAVGVCFLAFVAFVIVARIRRRTAVRKSRPPVPPPPSPVFDVAELLAMLQTGQVTPEEFERLRAAVLRRQDALPPVPPTGKRGFDVLPSEPAPPNA